MKRNRAAPICLFFLAAAAVDARAQTPLGPAFTYQGQLKQNGIAMNGTVNLRFSLWDAAGSGSPPTGGTQVGGIDQITNVPVTNGLFTVTLNDAAQFGGSAFNGQARWLQIEVCSDSTCASRTTLTPRQAMTAAPYATFAAKPWSQPIAGGNDISYTAGNVGIGTSTTTAGLHVLHEPITPSGTLALEGSTHTYVAFYPDGFAAGRPTAESSHTQTYSSSNLTDGNQGTYWESANNTFPQWAQVDLGSARSASKVVLQLPPSWGARSQTLTLQASGDGSSFTTVVASNAYTFSPSANNTVTLTVDSQSGLMNKTSCKTCVAGSTFAGNVYLTGGNCSADLWTWYTGSSQVTVAWSAWKTTYGQDTAGSCT